MLSPLSLHASSLSLALLAALPLLLDSVGVHAFRAKGSQNGDDANPAPALVRVLHQFTNHERRQYSSHPEPVAGGACADVGARIAKSLPFGGCYFWLCCV